MRHPARLRRLLAGTAMALGLGLAVAATAAPTDAPSDDPAGASWRPTVSERLVRLPASVIGKSIDRDFSESSLGQLMARQEEDLRYKLRSLDDIDQAIGLAEGEQKVALAHKYLLEKQAYIALASERNRLVRQQLETKKQVLDGVLARLSRDDAALTENRKALVEEQQAARKRFEQAVAMADKMLGANPITGQSRYADEYEQKYAALQQLKERIAQHPMNRDAVVDGEEMSKADYLRRLVAGTEGELALLGVEEEMLGYMARLVALDAMALAEQMADPELADSDLPEPDGVEHAVRYFVTP